MIVCSHAPDDLMASPTVLTALVVASFSASMQSAGILILRAAAGNSRCSVGLEFQLSAPPAWLTRAKNSCCSLAARSDTTPPCDQPISATRLKSIGLRVGPGLRRPKFVSDSFLLRYSRP